MSERGVALPTGRPVCLSINGGLKTTEIVCAERGTWMTSAEEIRSGRKVLTTPAIHTSRLKLPRDGASPRSPARTPGKRRRHDEA